MRFHSQWHGDFLTWAFPIMISLTYSITNSNIHKYTSMVFHLDARYKMTPYFPKDNICCTEEKKNHNKASSTNFSCLISFQSIKDLFNLFNLPRLMKLFPAFQKNSQCLINQADLCAVFWLEFSSFIHI